MAKSLVQKQFGANAPHYATSSPHAVGASLARLIELTAPEKHWRVLDVATGAGHTAAAFAPHVASVIASDVTEEMLHEAKELARRRGLTNIEVAAAEAERLPFDDAAFDLVTCRIAAHHFADVPAFLAEVRRVLKVGGRLALVDNVAPDSISMPGLSDARLQAAAETFNALEKLRDSSHARALAATEWQTLVGKAGLAIEHVELLAKPMMFSLWCRNTGVPAATVPKLEAMMRDADEVVRAFLDPQPVDGDIRVMFREILLIARKS
jgi:ubiquinone/menaquinone biosynthesis C-methylase UbiE